MIPEKTAEPLKAGVARVQPVQKEVKLTQQSTGAHL